MKRLDFTNAFSDIYSSKFIYEQSNIHTYCQLCGTSAYTGRQCISCIV